MLTITGKTKLLGIIGDPIEHSLSPVMQNAALAEMGLDWVYLPFPVQGKNLTDAIAGFSAVGLQGFNVTIPHKQAIIFHLTEVSPLARAVGAVNTVWRSEAGWCGTNTDVAGFLAPLQSLDRDWSSVNVLCLGNGGAARAVVAGCTQLGCKTIQVVGRNPDKLQHFQDSWQGSPFAESLAVHPWEALPDLLPTAGLIVNTTPIGMHPQVDQSPLTIAEANLISSQAIAYDLIYIPNPTQFLRQAHDRGALAIDGLEMLVQQGAAALKIWTQQAQVPVDTMRHALQKHLGLI
ncbi:shikimate dehydrogenase [Alkalinema sp. FACHB-956]|uniref:shikimate dehydrogenase n=1 Tax=Alkalinema sp. FACHB-956 TaxID=2692768 RepID=UPI001684C406|nr:shikimate dehydrogenase [Alkalinema sp. FACHB-956]MBD2329880.1 shikimate dehydrogenase [Alkalinema sp. FACHB-956]